METDSKVSGESQISDDQPLENIPAKLRLGHLIRRYRVAANKSLKELAEHLNLPAVNVSEVERGLAMFKAEELQATAVFLKVLYEPLLVAARDWNRAVFEERGETGVQLAETTITERALHGGDELMERELIRAHDDFAFVANVSRELAIKADKAARRIRSLLAERGVPIPDAPEYQIVECAGIAHDAFDGPPNRPKLRLGFDFVLSFDPPPDETGRKPPMVYFCSEECADEFRVAHGYKPLPPEESQPGEGIRRDD